MPAATYSNTRQVATRYGEISYFAFDGPIGDSLEKYGEWAGVEISFLKQFMSPGDVAVDGGANIGIHTLAFSRFCAAEGQVIAFEPSPEIFQLLANNTRALENVRAIRSALGDGNGNVELARIDPGRRSNVGATRAMVGGNARSTMFSQQANIATIDGLELERLDFVKLDVEGTEVSALQGALATISRLRPKIFLELLSVDVAVGAIELLRPFSYKPFFCTFSAYNRESFTGSAENIFGHAREAALLMLPDDSSLPEMVSGATVAAVDGYEDIAARFLEMPRYGDASPHDRVSTRVVGERSALEAKLAVAGRQIAEQSQELANAREAVDAMRANEMANVRELEDHLQTVSAIRQDLALLRSQMEAVRAEVNHLGETHSSVDRLKADLASLRGALLSRAEDRSGIALALDRLRGDLGESGARLQAQASDIGDLGAEIRGLAQGALDLSGRLDLVERSARRFELFYGSLPLRWFRKSYLALRGLVRR